MDTGPSVLPVLPRVSFSLRRRTSLLLRGPDPTLRHVRPPSPEDSSLSPTFREAELFFPVFVLHRRHRFSVVPTFLFPTFVDTRQPLPLSFRHRPKSGLPLFCKGTRPPSHLYPFLDLPTLPRSGPSSFPQSLVFLTVPVARSRTPLDRGVTPTPPWFRPDLLPGTPPPRDPLVSTPDSGG